MNAFVKLRQKISPYLFLVPCLIVFGLFLFYPFAKTIYLSLYKTDKLGQASCLSASETISICLRQNLFITACL